MLRTLCVSAKKMSCFGSTHTYKGQDYTKLKKEAQQKGTLFIDLEFPPDDRSLFYSQGKLADVVWKRPKVMCEDFVMLFIKSILGASL